MTEENKDILIARMIDDPVSLTERDQALIEHDDELRQIYEMAAEVRSAGLSKQEFDLDEEWERFRPALDRKAFSRPFAYRRIFRYAAIFAGVVALAAFLIDVGHKKNSVDESRSLTGSQVIDTIKDSPRSAMPSGHIASASDAAESSLSDSGEVSLRHPCRTESSSRTSYKSTFRTVTESVEDCPGAVSSDPASGLSTNTVEEMDVDEYLRIQQSRIENDLALRYAEMVRDEVAYLRSVNAISPLAEDFQYVMSEIHKVTLE